MTNEDEDSLGPPPPPSHAPPEAPSDSVTMSVLPSQSEDIADEKDEQRYASQKDDDDTVAENQLSPVEDSQPSITARNAHYQDNNDDNESDDKGFEEQPASRTKLYLAAVAFLLLVAAVTLGVGLGTGSFTKDAPSSIVSGPSPNSPTTTSNPTTLTTQAPAMSMPMANASVSPVKAPVKTPVSAPVKAPVTAAPTPPTSVRQSLFYEYLSGISQNPTAWSQSSTPEAAALDWIINEDPLALNPSDQSAENLLRITQRYALATLWFSTLGWKNTTNWLTENECKWFGVTCFQSSAEINLAHLTVKSIQLDENGLVGVFSPDVTLLTNLTLLSMSRNALSGSIPTSLPLLSNLEFLFLDGNQLSNKVGNIDFGIFKSLRQLDVSGNSLNGTLPASLWELFNLTTLVLDFNQFSGSLPIVVANLQALLRFSVVGNAFNGTVPSEFGLMTKLDALLLVDNSFSGSLPTELGNMEALTYLDVLNNDLTGTIPPELMGATNLEYLFLSNNSLTGQVPSEVGSLTKLRKFLDPMKRNFFRFVFVSRTNNIVLAPQSVSTVTQTHSRGISLTLWEA